MSAKLQDFELLGSSIIGRWPGSVVRDPSEGPSAQRDALWDRLAAMEDAEFQRTGKRELIRLHIPGEEWPRSFSPELTIIVAVSRMGPGLRLRSYHKVKASSLPQ
jgi:hypothetical protein